MKINKTNAARLLDKAKIAYELIPYEVDENDLSAIHVAASLGENIEQVFKTLVLHGDKSGYFVCVIPTYIHETCRQFPYIYVSAGVRGLQIKLAPGDLIRESRAEICRLFEE